MKRKIKLLIVIPFLALITQAAFGQYYYIPYYGKNKVIYENFKWDKYETAHFDIYTYTKDVAMLKTLASFAESAYQEISRDIKHELSAAVPLIFYKTLTDFQQTNLYNVPEGVLGAAEPLLYRVALHGDMPPNELQDLVKHELTHIFEYDLLWGSPGGVIYAVFQPPQWVMEGFSEYTTGSWSSWSSLIVRDTVLNDRIPEMTEGGHLFSQYPMARDPAYDFGHAIYDFIEHKYGKNGIREFWQSMKSSSVFGRSDPIHKAFNLKPKEFNHEFKKFIREKHRHLLTRENPEDYSLSLGPEFPLNPYYFAFSHAISPSGEVVAALTYNIKDYDIDILLISTKDGEVIKNITKGYTTKYEFIKYEIDPSSGKNLTWSPDGDRIAFFGRQGRKHSLFIINALTGKTLQSIPIPQDQPSSPGFYPEGNELLYGAFDTGKRDIFKINLETKKILNLTEDDLFEKAPTISPDGRHVAYTIHLDTYDKLFISPIDDLKIKKQLTFGKGNTISPEFTKDSKELYFSGDMREAYNIYSLALETGTLKRYTDVRTGNFFPTPLVNVPNGLVFSSFNKGAFQIFKGEFEGEEEKTIAFTDVDPEKEYTKFEPILTLDINKDDIKTQKGIGKLYMVGRPPVEAVLSTDGSIYGGSALSFSDIFADYTFTIVAYQVRSFRSYYFSFLNQKRRLQYLAEVYSYTMFYYPSYSYYDPYLYNFLTYSDAIATRDISGASFSAFYPINRYYRIQGSVYFQHWEENFFDPYLIQLLTSRGTAFNYFMNGNMIAFSLALVGETTRFKYYGPTAGNTFRLSVTQGIPISESFLSNTTVRGDLRQYFNIGGDFLFAMRWNGFGSWGKNPFISYFGGNNEVRSVPFYSLIGTEGWYGNLEFRIPLVNVALTFIGQIGPIRGVLFLDMARSKMKGQPSKYTRYVGIGPDNNIILKEYEALGSFGYGFEFFLFGLPMHLEFVKRLEFPSLRNPFDYDVVGGWMTKFWIGFDF
ncbi:MAG: PD40 domain-containing protein [Candidatus Aminicenantes bacterium]|nr:PD40 domain-containing protein [Candidatus Aminicenantes bacterium]